MDHKKNSGINFTYKKFVKKFKNEELLSYIQDRILKYNHNEDIELNENLFEDYRKDNAKIYDSKEIKRAYLEAQEEYLKDNPKKKKLPMNQASKILNISDKTIKKALS